MLLASKREVLVKCGLSTATGTREIVVCSIRYKAYAASKSSIPSNEQLLKEYRQLSHRGYLSSGEQAMSLAPEPIVMAVMGVSNAHQTTGCHWSYQLPSAHQLQPRR